MVAQEVGSNVKMVQDYYAAFGFEDYSFRLSLWDPERTEKYSDQPENWKKSEDRLRQIMDDLGVVYTESVGEAAFYGPRSRYSIQNCIGTRGVYVDHTT